MLGALRDAVFFSLAELNAAIRKIVAAINAEPFQKREGTRNELFERYERPAAKTLPAQRYEYAAWHTSIVHQDHHIEVARGYYSVPYTLVGQRMDVRAERCRAARGGVRSARAASDGEFPAGLQPCRSRQYRLQAQSATVTQHMRSARQR